MKPFEYFEPKTVVETIQILTCHGEKARIMAGGVDLVPRLRRGEFESGGCVVNIQKVPGLGEIASDGKGGMRFGAMATLHALELSTSLKEMYPILHEAVHQITSVQTKFMGTAVGNLCIATPASDVSPVLIALGAEIKIVGPGGERNVPMERFYLDYRRTCLEKGEMVAGVALPPPQPGTGSAFMNLVRTHADIAKLAVAATLVMRDGVCQDVRIGIGAAAATVLRAPGAEAVLRGQKIVPELIEQAANTATGEIRPITDIRSTAEYRTEMTKVLVRRVLEKSIENVAATA